ncbi:RHS repeat domain-containing protein [Zooshikella ganghwensis]|uniref:RHS repeat-associated core domain-containing protein n=1 Tax=Zooshikella ganghwensis TaxID=202772 RepID=A0A4P9VK66_9GAMM|nr:RHS repeat-associated core domain-containing protein [Zooshikella ganghwensis]RDH43688.1 RHS repeat-associated core domain-containing protein [Zooshikella ganghwensis]
MAGCSCFGAYQETKVSNEFNPLNQLIEAKGAQMLKPEFDKAGNMIKGITVKGAVFEAKYDAENRLTEITFTDQEGVKHKRQYRYFYNSFLAEIQHYQNDKLTQTTRFVREDNLALQERDAENTVKRHYIWGLNKGGGVGGLLSLTQDGQHYYYVYDGKGNIVGVVNQANEVVAGYHYEPFGKRVSKSGAFEQPFGFSTKRYDEDTGLVYYGYRFYIPHQSIWLNRDPLGEAGGINLYGFVNSNPIMFIDPYGLWAWGDPLPQGLVDFSAGFGDTLSFGATAAIRDAADIGSVDQCSSYYEAGEWSGVGLSLAMGGAHLGRNAIYQTGKTGGLGLGVSRLFSDPRKWGSVRSMWSKAAGGGDAWLKANGQHLHHWLIPQRSLKVNAGFNYMPISAGLNSWMNGSTAFRRGVERGFRGIVLGIYGAIPTAAIRD